MSPTINHLNRKIIHVDMDAFYASVEQRENKQYQNKPLIVGQGVVTTCSYEARKFGVKSAMPVNTALRLCPRAIVVPVNMELYKKVSQDIFNIFTKYTNKIEKVSVDEAYLDVTTNNLNIKTGTKLAQIIQADIYQTLNLTCSCGVSYNKFLAKTASDINKPYGIFVITPKMTENFLNSLSIINFFGIGNKTAQKMISMGIYSGKELRELSLADLEKHFKTRGNFYYNIVRGIDNREVIANRPIHSIGSERTLNNYLLKREDITQFLEEIFTLIYPRFSEKQLFTKTITVKIKYINNKSITRSHSLDHFTNNKEELHEVAFDILRNINIETQIKLLGLSFSNFSKQATSKKNLKHNHQQVPLF
ncbi:MAG: DNA polymerase IV [Mycoplasmatales bacterium]